MIVDKENLKKYALLLEQDLHSLAKESRDVRFLLGYEPLMRDIGDAKEGWVTSPRWDHGLGRWITDESSILDYHDLSKNLGIFRLLLRGWKTPFLDQE